MNKTIVFRAEELEKPWDQIKNPVTGRSEEDKALAVHTLAERCKPQLEGFAAKLDSAVGCFSEVNVKNRQTALMKARRPAVTGGKRGYSIVHIRDMLRFRSRLLSCDQILAVFNFFENAVVRGEIRIIKIDWDKFFRPKAFGWRMIAIDFRLLGPDLMCEYYFTYADLVTLNDKLLHKLFEDWRDTDSSMEPISRLRERAEDMEIARYTNQSWFVRSMACDRGETVRIDLVRSPGAGELNPFLRLQRQADDQLVSTLNALEDTLKREITVV